MHSFPTSLEAHRVAAAGAADMRTGTVVYAPIKSLWFLGMAGAGLIGGGITFSWSAFALFLAVTGTVLLLGHSLGSHRKFIHNSYQCPKWLEYLFVYLGTQVGLAGPIGLLKQHELRDYAQRLDNCHDYLKHGRSFWQDAWWQLNCELRLQQPPIIRIEPSITNDRFYRFLESTWMLQQLPWALLFYVWGGWGFVFWGVCMRVTAGVFGHWLIGYFAHNQGAMHFHVNGAAVQGRNIRLVSLLTMGECWHNNHHAYPGSALLGLAPGEWDPGWWVLLLLNRLGLAWGFVLPKDLPYRPELEALDATLSEWSNEPRENMPACFLVPTTLGGAMKLLRRLHALNVEEKGVMEWPGSVLPKRIATLALGRKVSIILKPSVRRLSFSVNRTWITGFPALIVAIAQRNWIAYVVALLLLPLAVCVERVRRSLADGRVGGRLTSP